jgi:hypothetical protein
LQHCLCTIQTPARARQIHAVFDQVAAGSFNDAGGNWPFTLANIASSTANIDPDKSTVVWIVIVVPSRPITCVTTSASIG